MPTHIVEDHIEVAPGVRLAVRVHRPGAAVDAGAATGPGAAVDPGAATGPAPPPVLAVHGLASNARLWDGVAEVLAASGHTVAAVDQRGHGQSDKPDDGYDFATLASDLVAVLDHLGWDEPSRLPVVAGQSWGGNVVVELAARHPHRVGALVLVDGGTIELSERFADWPTCEVALAPPPLAGTPFADVERWIRNAHADWPESGIAGTLANIEARPDGTAQPWLSRAHHMAILRQLWEHHPSQRWADLPMPVLIISAESPSGPGGRYDAGKRAEVDRAVRMLARGGSQWIAGDHDLHAQYPDRVAALIHSIAIDAPFPDTRTA